jgi:uncharacterized protein involved in exopolysaccharide biosynthesis
MPDIIAVLNKRWKLLLALTLTATLLALIVSLLRPKEYLSTVTALPANSMLGDKARIFNSNIEALYPEIGTPDELDRIEGTAKLDTIYLAVVNQFSLAPHYGMDQQSSEDIFKAALTLKKKTDIRRTAYGELRIRVWDGDPVLAAQLANGLLQTLNDIHQHIQSLNNNKVLAQLKNDLATKQRQLDSIERRIAIPNVNSDPGINDSQAERFFRNESAQSRSNAPLSDLGARSILLQNQVKQYLQMIGEYELAVSTTPQVLIAVESARPALMPDKPKVLLTTLLALGASFLFSFLLAVFVEGRNQKA